MDEQSLSLLPASGWARFVPGQEQRLSYDLYTTVMYKTDKHVQSIVPISVLQQAAPT